MTISLRPYQERVLADLWAWFEAHGDGDPIVEACVGAGKSVLIAELCRRAIEQAPGTRILMVVHVMELIQQNAEKLRHVWPGAPVGIYSASVGSRQIGRAITYATIGSVYKRAHELGHVDIVLVDEAHMVSPNEATMYRRLIDELRARCPLLRVVGWTGTAFRGDGVWLTQHGLFTHVAARVTMAELLADGFLAPLVTAPIETRIDTTGVCMQGGDYVVSALARASDKAELVTKACAELVRLAVDRKRWLVFAVTVEHAHNLANELRQVHGIACAVVSAKTPKAEREAAIRAFRAGRLRAIVNVAVLTTGFDVPELDCIALLRATRSPVLMVQIAGRGMRTAPGKDDGCLWLDFTDTTATLGPVDAIRGRARKLASANEKRDAPVKYCDACGNPNPTAVLECASCGHLFPAPQRVTHSAIASAAAVLSDNKPQWHSITSVGYRLHAGRDGKPDTLRVDYYSIWRVVASEWICLEHMGYARQKAELWWQQRAALAAGTPVNFDRSLVPSTVDEALERTAELREPVRIAVQPDGKYTKIVGDDWAHAKEAS